MSERKLSEEDQARVDEYLRSGYNSVERKPFRPLILMVILLIAVTSLTLLSMVIARYTGVY